MRHRTSIPYICLGLATDDAPEPRTNTCDLSSGQQCGDEEVVIDIRRLAIIRGNFSPRAFGLLMEWASIHQDDLLAAWDQAVKAQAPMKIAPLA